MTNIQTTLNSLAFERDVKGIQSLRDNLVTEKMKLDKFFSMFLNKFERKMDPDKTHTPIWDLYKKKSKEYNDLQHSITIADYYLNKFYV